MSERARPRCVAPAARRRGRVLARAAACLLATSALLAAPPAPAQAGGGFSAAFDAALANDAEYRASRYELQAREQAVPIARASLLPNLGASYSESLVRGDRESLNVLGQEFTQRLDYRNPVGALQLRAPLLNLEAMNRYYSARSQVDGARSTFAAARAVAEPGGDEPVLLGPLAGRRGTVDLHRARPGAARPARHRLRAAPVRRGGRDAGAGAGRGAPGPERRGGAPPCRRRRHAHRGRRGRREPGVRACATGRGARPARRGAAHAVAHHRPALATAARPGGGHAGAAARLRRRQRLDRGRLRAEPQHPGAPAPAGVGALRGGAQPRRPPPAGGPGRQRHRRPERVHQHAQPAGAAVQRRHPGQHPDLLRRRRQRRRRAGAGGSRPGRGPARRRPDAAGGRHPPPVSGHADRPGEDRGAQGRRGGERHRTGRGAAGPGGGRAHERRRARRDPPPVPGATRPRSGTLRGAAGPPAAAGARRVAARRHRPRHRPAPDRADERRRDGHAPRTGERSNAAHVARDSRPARCSRRRGCLRWRQRQ